MGIFSALLALCVGNSPVTGEFPSQRSVTQSLDVSFALRLNKGLSKQSRGWWFESPSWSLWRQRNGNPHTRPARLPCIFLFCFCCVWAQSQASSSSLLTRYGPTIASKSSNEHGSGQSKKGTSTIFDARHQIDSSGLNNYLKSKFLNGFLNKNKNKTAMHNFLLLVISVLLLS